MIRPASAASRLRCSAIRQAFAPAPVWKNEARILAEIAHEGLVKLVAVLDCGEHGPALVMERLHGESMRSYLQWLVGSGRAGTDWRRCASFSKLP